MSYQSKFFIVIVLAGVIALVTVGSTGAQTCFIQTTALSPMPTPASTIMPQRVPEKDIWDKLDSISKLVSAVFQIFAIIAGGIWTYRLFLWRRQKYPRAKLEHTITDKPIADNKIWVHVVVTVSNIGDVLLSLIYGETWIQQVLPLSSSMKNTFSEKEDPVQDEETEITWPLIETRIEEWDKDACQVEPGESDQSHYDFVVDRNIQIIRVYSYFRNVTQGNYLSWWRKLILGLRKEEECEIGWRLVTIYDLQSSQRRTKKVSPWYHQVVNLLIGRNK